MELDSEPVVYLTQKDKRLAKLIQIVGPLEYTIPTDSFRFLVRSIINQKLSNRVSKIMMDRLIKLLDGNVTVEGVEQLSDDQIRSIGVSHSKVNYIRNLADAVKSGEVDFSKYPRMDDQAVIDNLKQIKGIGNWSAKLYVIIVLNRPDLFIIEDVALFKGIRSLKVK